VEVDPRLLHLVRALPPNATINIIIIATDLDLVPVPVTRKGIKVVKSTSINEDHGLDLQKGTGTVVKDIDLDPGKEEIPAANTVIKINTGTRIEEEMMIVDN